MRYDNNKILQDENGNRYLNRTRYPVVPIKDTDVLINAKYGMSYMNLAYQYYGKTELWWIISRANDKVNGSVFRTIGSQIRVPIVIGEVITEFERLNK